MYSQVTPEKWQQYNPCWNTILQTSYLTTRNNFQIDKVVSQWRDNNNATCLQKNGDRNSLTAIIHTSHILRWTRPIPWQQRSPWEHTMSQKQQEQGLRPQSLHQYSTLSSSSPPWTRAGETKLAKQIPAHSIHYSPPRTWNRQSSAPLEPPK